MKNIKPLFLLLAFAMSLQLMAQQGVEFTNIKEINGSQLDFSPIPFGNGVVFTTSKSNRFLQCPPQNAGDYTDLKYSEKNSDGSLSKPVSLSGNVNGKYNDGAAAFNPAGNKMIFTRNNLDGKNASDVIDLKLYSADLDGSSWGNVTELPFNSDDWSTCHPALSKDGTLLVFSSNRTGSKGGSMDLYWAKWENGVWSIPTSLGDMVNSDSSDLFPFLDEFNNLFFSSNRPGGSGGLDIYVATMNASTGQWGMAENLGAPFNQTGDDVSFVSLNNGTEGYIASDRTHSEAKGRDDIYYWKTAQPKEVLLAVVDKETNERLPGAKVLMQPADDSKVLDRIYGGMPADKMPLLTDANGEAKVMVRKDMTYSILTTKEEYKDDKREVAEVQFPAAPTPYVIPLEKDKCLVKLVIEVVEDESGNPIPLADIKVVDKTTGQTVNLTTDANGEAVIAQVNCDHEYEITASKQPYYPNTITAKPLKPSNNSGEVRVKVPLKKPFMVTLEPIFFDFDRYYIRKRDAQPTLDNLAETMKKYTTLKVRLGGNADARGRGTYNDRLSANRANSAKNYLVNKGISKDRISTEQFGETNPVNNCTDNVYCPETDHQLNRRVDVSAESHNEPGVEFRTRPVSEMKVVSDRKDRPGRGN